jgi:malate synthase
MEMETETLSTPTQPDSSAETGAIEINLKGEFSPFEKFFPEGLRQTLIRLHKSLEPRRQELLSQRQKRQDHYDNGELPGYLNQNSKPVKSDWKVAPMPEDLLTRRVEITGPVNSAKMVINMLSRNDDGVRADMAMLDFEDSMKPDWINVLDGIKNVKEAAEKTLRLKTKKKTYELDPEDMAGLMVRVRGLHLNEENVTIDGEPISAGLFDLAVCFYHTAFTLLQQDKTPKYYVPKCEHYREARWWNQLFTNVEEEMKLPVSTLRATFLIETLPAAFQMEEILYEYRDHAAGLNGGRWDKIFSDIKVLKKHKDRVMADRSWIDMSRSWMDNYVKRMIKICHERGAFAMGGMSAFTPGKTSEIRKEQTDKVLADKKNEFDIGHDGCWVSHPYFITHAMNAFPKRNQMERKLEDFDRCPDLLPKSEGPKTIEGLRKNIRVGIGYMHGWNNGIGCVSWDNMMEDMATLEISRAQTWQWLHHKIELDKGNTVTKALVGKVFEEELEKINQEIKDLNLVKKQEVTLLQEFDAAAKKAEQIFTMDELPDFLNEAEAAIQG